MKIVHCDWCGKLVPNETGDEKRVLAELTIYAVAFVDDSDFIDSLDFDVHKDCARTLIRAFGKFMADRKNAPNRKELEHTHE